MLYNDSWHVVLLAVESVRIEKKVSFFVATHFVAKQSHTHLLSLSYPSMKQFTPQQKHSILLHLQSRHADQTPDDIAHLHDVSGGRRTLNRWKEMWDGSAASLEHKQGAGRPRALSNRQVYELIHMPIRNKNRSHSAINYPQLLPSVQHKSGKQIALRTLQNYGKRDVGARMKHTKKRTAQESEYTYT